MSIFLHSQTVNNNYSQQDNCNYKQHIKAAQRFYDKSINILQQKSKDSLLLLQIAHLKIVFDQKLNEMPTRPDSFTKYLLSMFFHSQCIFLHRNIDNNKYSQQNNCNYKQHNVIILKAAQSFYDKSINILKQKCNDSLLLLQIDQLKSVIDQTLNEMPTRPEIFTKRFMACDKVFKEELFTLDQKIQNAATVYAIKKGILDIFSDCFN